MDNKLKLMTNKKTITKKIDDKLKLIFNKINDK